jgi:spermidine/putrescine transport system permease protein
MPLGRLTIALSWEPQVAKSTGQPSSLTRPSAWLALPAIGWFLWFLMIPLGIVLIYSFAEKGTYGGAIFRLNLENYSRAADWIYLRVMWNSLRLASVTAFSCLLLGFPMAYVMATAGRRVQAALLILIVVPFWTNFVVRAYAVKLLLADHGPINEVRLALKVIVEPLAFINSPASVWLGMVTNYLPFMVLPLYVSLEKFDFSLLEAARDLGATHRQALLKILIPLCRPGMITGLIFVFAPALGEFVIPDLLGGAKVMMVGNLITEQFLKARDWPFGSALSLLLMALVLSSLALYLWLQPTEKKR